jgi:hypothetical protein
MRRIDMPRWWRGRERAEAQPADDAGDADLRISPSTMMTHVTHILAKLGADNRTAAAALAGRRGLA